MIGMATAWPSPVLPMIRSGSAPVAMDNTQISWMVSLMFLGHTLSPIPIGRMMDRFGRKWIMYALNICPFSAWIITYFAVEPWHLYLARFLNGIWAGTSYTACAVYIGEIAQPSIRGSLSNFNNLLKTVGGLCVFVVGPYVSFKVLAALCGLVPALFFILASYIPESPYFLLMTNKKEESKKALKWLRGNIEQTDLELELSSIEKSVIAQTETKASFKDIFIDRASRKAFIITIILSVVKTLSGYDVMMAFTSTTLPEKAFASLSPNECVIILGAISALSCVGSTFILDRFPRRALLAVSSLGCAVTTLTAGSWFYLDDNTDVDVDMLAQIPFYSFAIHAVVYSIGLGPIVASLKGELFSANIKSLCSAITTIVFAVLGFISTKFYLVVADSVGMYGNYLIYAVGCAVGTVFIMLYVVETRGKTLQEIQVELSVKKQSTCT